MGTVKNREDITLVKRWCVVYKDNKRKSTYLVQPEIADYIDELEELVEKLRNESKE